MNKTELIEGLAERTGSAEDEVQRHVEALAEVVGAALKDGDEVRIPGSGKFYVQKRDAREGTNPQTKKRTRILASRAPRPKDARPRPTPGAIRARIRTGMPTDRRPVRNRPPRTWPRRTCGCAPTQR